MSSTAVFTKTRHFCNVNLFLMSLIFYFSFFYATKFVFCQKCLLLFRQITHRLWSMQSTDTEVPLWNILLSLVSQGFALWMKTPHNSLCLKDWMSSPSETLMNSNSTHKPTHTHTRTNSLRKYPAVIPWRHCAYFDWSPHFDCKPNTVLSQSASRCWQANKKCWIRR